MFCNTVLQRLIIIFIFCRNNILNCVWMICGNWLRLSLGSILKLVKHFKGDEKPLFINPVLGIVLWTLQVHALNKEQFGQKSERCYRQRKWDGSFDGFCGCYPWGRAFTNGSKKLYQVALERKTSITKTRLCVRLWLIMWPWRTILNCINQNNGRRTHRCLLLLKSGEECSFGFDSRNRKYICRRCSLCRYQWWCDLARMQNDCWMHECSFMERWKNLKTGLTFYLRTSNNKKSEQLIHWTGLFCTFAPVKAKDKL